MKTLLEENETLTQIVNDAGRQSGRIHQSTTKNPANKRHYNY